MVGTHEFNMSLREIKSLKVGEMVDLINCLSVYRGAARYKTKLTYDQIMQLR